MKSMKGRFLKKLKLISTIRRGLSLQLNPTPEKFSDLNCESLPVSEELEDGHHYDTISVSSSVRDPEDGEEDFISDKDDLSLYSLESMHDFEDAKLSVSEESTEFPLSGGGGRFGLEDTSTDSEPDFFPEPEPGEVPDCLPERNNSIIFYSTSLRGIRKTFEDCKAIRFLLKSFRVQFEERDVSMHQGYRDELRNAMARIGEDVLPIPPKLFISGKCIGGAEEVVALHERGEFRELLEGMPAETSTSPCHGCRDVGFVICSSCNGSCRVVVDVRSETWKRCGDCNENGLVKCPICICC